jgi:dUTP pyrophosphatase
MTDDFKPSITKGQPTLKYKRLREDAFVPTRGSEYASGLDLASPERHFILAGDTKRIEIGIAFEIPEGYEIQLRPRSGLSLKTKLIIVNSPGTVDRDYKGDCSVLFRNTGNTDIVIERGDRIAQAVLCPVVIPWLEEIQELESTQRGSNGFGSTGV